MILIIKKAESFEDSAFGYAMGEATNSENIIDRIVWRDIERFVEFYELNKDFIEKCGQ